MLHLNNKVLAQSKICEHLYNQVTNIAQNILKLLNENHATTLTFHVTLTTLSFGMATSYALINQR